MTYFAGMAFPGHHEDPRIICDGQACGLVYRLPTDRPPPAWFMDGKAKPGWSLKREGDKRIDKCPRCKVKP